MTLDTLLELATHTLWDTLPMVPVLFVLYAVLEVLSHREGSRLRMRGAGASAFGPAAGALLGVIPQCGMSVFMTSLYLGGRVSTGTLVATYLATSDEAIPVLLAHGQQFSSVFLLIAIKVFVGIGAGLAIDAWLPAGFAPGTVNPTRSWIQVHVESEMHEAPWSRALAHSARRTLEIAGWVFVISLALAAVIHGVGVERLAEGAAEHPVLEMFGTALFGLIPNCSASIAIAEAYLRGVLSFGATVAGLCAGAGYGPILLFRRGVLIHAVRLLVLCFVLSLAAGTLVSIAAHLG